MTLVARVVVVVMAVTTTTVTDNNRNDVHPVDTRVSRLSRARNLARGPIGSVRQPTGARRTCQPVDTATGHA